MENTHSSMKNYAKYLGVAYVLYITLAMLNTMFFKQGIYNFEMLDENEAQFRFAQAVDIFMFIAVICASWAQYLVTKSVNKDIAFLALLFRFGEGLLGFVATVIVLTILIVLQNPDFGSAFQSEQLQVLAKILLKMSGPMWDVLLIIMGFGATLFMYLFYISAYIPRWLSLWGIFTYVSMIVYGFANVLMIDPPKILGYFMAPGALFELIFGLWLLIKGVNLTEVESKE